MVLARESNLRIRAFPGMTAVSGHALTFWEWSNATGPRSDSHGCEGLLGAKRGSWADHNECFEYAFGRLPVLFG